MHQRGRAWIFLSPSFFSTSGGMGPTVNVVYKRVASTIAQKHDKTYSKILHWIRCKLSYSLLRSAIMCLRGAATRAGSLFFNLPTTDFTIGAHLKISLDTQQSCTCKVWMYQLLTICGRSQNYENMETLKRWEQES